MIKLDTTVRKKLILAMAGAVSENAEHLTTLDQAIGDGDHGANLKRGFTAVADEAQTIAGKPLPEGLKALGMKLVMTVGGASGPLFGTLFMALGKNLHNDDPDLAEFKLALEQAIDAVKARGKSEIGQKTMLDVLAPLAKALDENDPGMLKNLPGIAEQAAEATIPMLAIKGRASFLGERSIGHMDPGACSVALLTRIVCECLAGNS